MKDLDLVLVLGLVINTFSIHWVKIISADWVIKCFLPELQKTSREL